jgi:cystathionine beta-lyase
MALLTEKGGVALSDGLSFGDRGEGFMRFNFACPRSMLQEGLEGIKKALCS